MRGIWKFVDYYRLLAMASLLAGALTSVSAVHAQSEVESEVVAAAGKRCMCGRWTCPACQQRMLCEPCPPILPYQPNVSPDATPLAPIVPGQDTMPETPDSATANVPPTPSLDTSSLFASNLAAAGGSAFGSSLLSATTPEMMGDFFGPGGVPSFISRNEQTYSIPAPIPGYSLGRMKQTENSSLIPRDRLFFNYSLFDGVPIAPTPVTVNRFTPGFEKTFLDGLASFEMRVPCGTSLDNEILANGLSSNNQLLFGNMFFSLKGILLQKDNWLIAGGASLVVPTAADTKVLDPSGREILRIENQSTHLMPFIGGAIVPHNGFFAQWMVQCDMDVNGNPVIDVNGSQSSQIGTLQDFTLLYTDINIGYWLHRAKRHSQSCITGIAPIAEFHYNRSLNNADFVGNNSDLILQTIPAFDNINLQVGVLFNLRNRARLGIGYAVPVGNATDRVFDNEFRLTLNRYF